MESKGILNNKNAPSYNITYPSYIQIISINIHIIKKRKREREKKSAIKSNKHPSNPNSQTKYQVLKARPPSPGGTIFRIGSSTSVAFAVP